MTKILIQINQKKRLLSLISGLSLFFLLANPPLALSSQEKRENAVVRAVRNVSPAVVNISSQYEIRKNSNPFSKYGMDPWVEKFFHDFFSPEMERREKRTSLGSGVIIDGTHGFVLTNTHVVEKSTTIKVALKDEREFEATIVGMDPDSDLAVLKIKTDQPLPAAEMGNSDDIMIGESVIAIGNPFGFSHTVTTGVISAVNRSIKTSDRVFHQFIQTDASINPGNSGGPLLNINGELIGINTAIYAQAQGIGFAIPIDRAKRIISDLINYGAVVQPWVGLMVQALDSNLAAYLNIQNRGVMVKAVETGSPADKAGIQEGDILLSINEQQISSVDDYQLKLNDVSTGQTLGVKINRKGENKTVSIETMRFPMTRALDLPSQRLGIWVSEINEKTRAQYGLKASSGVFIVKLRRGSYLDRIGLNPGDIIHRIDEEQIENLSDFKAAMVKYRDKPSVVLLVQREAYLYHINAIMKDNG